MKQKLLMVVLIVIVGWLGYRFQEGGKEVAEVETVVEPTKVSVKEDEGPCVAAFRDGGGPYYLPGAPERSKLAPDSTKGEKLVVRGKLLENNCKTVVANAVVDVWHADEKGNYVDDWYRGRVNTDADGSYEFETVVPKGYGEGTNFRPPHIHFKIWIDDREIVTSQMFFPDVSGKSGFDEAYIVKLEKPNENGEAVNYAVHDIVLPI